jgi:hypothetical protein
MPKVQRADADKHLNLHFVFRDRSTTYSSHHAGVRYECPCYDVKSATPPKRFDLLFISAKQGMFRYWQDMFSPYLESFTPAFCAEAPEAESVN